MSSKQESGQQFLKRMGRKKATGKHYDNMDEICERFMLFIRKDYRGHKSEITPHALTKRSKRFAIAYGLSESDLIDALLRRQWIEVSAGSTWHFRFDLVRR